MKKEIDFSSYSFTRVKKEESNNSVMSEPLEKKYKAKPTKKDKNLKDPVSTLTKIREWREKNIAPVDVVGCERIYDQN